MQLSVTEQVAVLTALQKAVKAKLDEVRDEADSCLLAAYEEDGVVKKALKVGGVKVGDYIVVLTTDDWAVTDASAFEEFALAYGFASVESVIRPECMAAAVKLLREAEPELLCEEVKLSPEWRKLLTNAGGIVTFLDSGEVVPGVVALPPRVKCTQVRGCKPEDVLPRLRALGGVDALLLGDGDAA